MTSILQILAHYDGSLRPNSAESTEPLGAAGGFSGARFWRFRAGNGQLLVLRRWPRTHPARQHLAWIHANLRRAVLNGFGPALEGHEKAHVESIAGNELAQGAKPCLAKLPLPLPTRKNETIVEGDGHLWELTPWLDGEADYNRHASPARLASALETLAQLHAALAADNPDTYRTPTSSAPCIARRLDLIGRRIRQRRELRQAMSLAGDRQVDSAQWEILQHVDRHATAVAHSLTNHRDQRPACQVCVRDVWHDHLLFVEDRVSGIIDFGAMAVDSVTADIARLLGSLAGDKPQDWHQGLQAYQRIRPLSQHELEMVRVLDNANVLLSGWNWLSWIHLEQRQFDDMDRVHSRIAENIKRLRKLS